MTATVIVLSTADFHAAVWTNKQHLATRLARHMPVIYIESMGLRRPTVSITDAKRILSRLIKKSTSRDKHTTHKNLRVVKPHVIPLHNLSIVRALNTALLNRQIKKIIRQTGSKNVLWTFSPVTYGLEKHFDKTIYHSVDLLHTLPLMPASFMLLAECHLAQNADTIIASSTGVRDHLQEITDRPIQLWQNVADTSNYASTNDQDRKPRAVFAGNFTSSKIEFELFHKLAATGIELVLAGPSSIDGTRAAAELNELISRPNVTYVGNLGHDALALLLNSCTVGVIPYKVNDYTAGVFPMKIYEYQASGLAVVSTQLPSLQNVHDHDIHIVNNYDFVEAVTATIAIDRFKISARKQRASQHSWESRTKQALSLIREEAKFAN